MDVWGNINLKIAQRNPRSQPIVINPVQVSEDSGDDLLDDTPQDHPKRILAITVTKKVPTVPDVVLSPRTQQGYQFLDTKLIVMKGTLQGVLVKILFDTGSMHNAISSRIFKKLKLQMQPFDYNYKVELADDKGIEVWDRQVVGLPF